MRINCLPLLIEACEKSRYNGLLEDLVGDLLDRTQIKEIYQTLANLPQIDVKLTISGESLGETNKNIYWNASQAAKVYDLPEDSEFTIRVDMLRAMHNNSQFKRTKDKKAYAPKYPKAKDENWIIVLGVADELVGLKRVNNLTARQQSNLSFRTPNLKQLAKHYFELSVFIMSDVYMGLDQQFELKFNLLPKKSEKESIKDI